MMLYGRHLGIKGGVARKLDDLSAKELAELKSSDPKSFEIFQTVNEVKAEYRGTEFMKTGAVYRFARAGSQGNRVWLGYRDAGRPVLKTIEFPRQTSADGLCLADFVAPLPDSEKAPTLEDLKDNLALFAVTCGRGVRELAENLKNRGEYLKSHIVQVLAMESAEGYAEWLHAKIRSQWGVPDPIDMTMLERFQAKYVGKRYSFGYPACPRLDDQRILFDVLRPEEIGMQLTEGFMMEPEASVSAIAFHHPEACYFSVGKGPESANGADGVDS
jgi:5-methyltetrahydrofolate--homocysteine methyltransferase